MKWTIFIQQKMQVAALLFCIMFFIVLTNIIGKHNLDKINQSANSIYKDRLIPASDLYYISHHLHSRKALLENLLVSNTNQPATIAEISQSGIKINSLIEHFETTYLAHGETEILGEFKKNYDQYNKSEASILQLIKAGDTEKARQVFNRQIKPIFNKNIHTLGGLINIQTTIGKDLINQSHSNLLTFHLLSGLQIILAVLIGVLIVKLVLASKLTNTPKKYTMN